MSSKNYKLILLHIKAGLFLVKVTLGNESEIAIINKASFNESSCV